MPFDSLAMAAVRDEARTTLGGRIQRIIQPSAGTVALAVYAGGSRRWLVLSADARYGRVHFSASGLAKGFATPGSFIMLLRKYLDGARLADCRSVPYERILHLQVQGSAGTTTLVAEIMGKHSNLVLIDEERLILGALKLVPPRQSRVRPILTGRPYVPPPARGRDAALFDEGLRVDPAIEPGEARTAVEGAAPDVPASRLLLGLLPGCGPFLADQIAQRAGYAGDTPRSQIDPEALVAAAASLYALHATHEWRPCIFAAGTREDFAPYIPVGVGSVEPVETVSEAIDRCLSERESRDALTLTRTAVLSAIERARNAAESKMASLRRGLEATHAADEIMQNGQLILAYQHAIEPSSSQLAIPDLGMTISLDPRLSAAENAERAFRRYRKLRDAAKKIPELIVRTEAEAARLDDLAAFARLADSESALRGIERDLHLAAADPAPRQQKRGKGGPARYSRDGYTVLAGRNARENEEVTFRMAGRDDLWLHARGRTGAHVVIRASEPPDAVVQAAAELAAFLSEGREDTRVDVDVARVRDVRKISGGPPGRVTYRNSRTVRVAPAIGEWERQ